MLVYCNHVLPDPLYSMLQEDGTLSWLSQFSVATPFFRMEFRADEEEMEHGQINLYFGQRTVMLVRADYRGRIQLKAAAEYQTLAPQLFGVHQPHQFPKVQSLFREYLSEFSKKYAPVKGDTDATLTANFCRHYSARRQSENQLAVVDSRFRLHFRHNGAHLSDEVRILAIAEIKRKLELPDPVVAPTLHDAIGILSDGSVVLVSILNKRQTKQETLVDLLFYKLFSELLMEDGDADLNETLPSLWKQKQALGMVHGDLKAGVNEVPFLQPVLAGMDPREDWHKLWIDECRGLLNQFAPLLDGLRLWRLHKNGQILEERVLKFNT